MLAYLSGTKKIFVLLVSFFVDIYIICIIYLHIYYISVYIYISTPGLSIWTAKIDDNMVPIIASPKASKLTPITRLLTEEILHHLLLIKSYENGIFSISTAAGFLPSKSKTPVFATRTPRTPISIWFFKKKPLQLFTACIKTSHPFLLPCVCKSKFHIRVFHGHQPGRLTKKGRKISWTIFEMPIELFGSFPWAMGFPHLSSEQLISETKASPTFFRSTNPSVIIALGGHFSSAEESCSSSGRWNPMRWQLPSFFNLRSSQNHTSPFGTAKTVCCTTQVKAINLSNRISTLNHWSHRDFETTKTLVWNHQTKWGHTHTHLMHTLETARFLRWQHGWDKLESNWIFRSEPWFLKEEKPIRYCYDKIV